MTENAGDIQPKPEVELLHPFYLDTDMSMAFAAALDGGVALEREELEEGQAESLAVRKLRGNLRFFGSLGVTGERSRSESEAATTGSRLIRQHTEASIFLTLYDELRRSGRVGHGDDIDRLDAGEIVSISAGPAVAPLRRVVDQVIRLLDVAIPFSEGVDDDATSVSAGGSRQQRRQAAREAAKRPADPSGDEEDVGLAKLRAMFVALQADLDRSGMIDVVISRDEKPTVILTLDERLVTEQALELLHTSTFTVVGKVTHVWRSEDEFVNLYRRSVMSLVPALTQTITWGMFMLLMGLASGSDASELEATARKMAGAEPNDETASDSDTMLAIDAVTALNPAVSGPAIQILPLAICA